MEIDKLIEDNRKKFVNYAARKLLYGDTYLAEDLVQDATYKALKAKDQYKPTHKFTTWFITILHNTHIDQYRKKKLKTVDITSFKEDAEGNDGLENVVEGCNYNDYNDQAEDIEKLYEAINTALTEKERRLVNLDLSGYKYYQISEILDIPEGTVKATLWRAKQKLLEFFTKTKYTL